MSADGRPLPEGWIEDFDPQYQRNFWVDVRKEPPVSIWHHPLDDAEYSNKSFAPPPGPPPGASPYEEKPPVPQSQPSPQPRGSSPYIPQKESKSSKIKSFLGLGSSSRPQGYGQGGYMQQQPMQQPMYPQQQSYPQQQPYMQPQQQPYMHPQQQQPYMQPQQPMYVQQQRPSKRMGGGGGGMGSMLPMAGGLGAGMLGGAFLAHEFDESQQDAYEDGYDDGGGGDFDDVEYALPLSTQNDLDLNYPEDEQSNFAISIPHPIHDHHLLIAPSLSINLHSPAIPTIGLFYDDEAESVHLLLVTQSSALLRLSVPLFVLNSPSSENLPDGWATEYILNSVESDSSQISTVNPVDLNSVLLGLVDGTLVLCEQPRGDRTLLGMGLVSYYETQWSESQMRHSSILSSVKSFLPNPFSSYANSAIGPPTQIISVSSHITENSAFAFTLSRDRKLRVWSLIHRSCIRTIALGDQYDFIPGDPRKLLTTYSTDIDDDDGIGFISVHLPDYATPGFYIYSFEINRNAGLGELNLIAERTSEPGLELHDMCIINHGQPKLWALYEKSGIPLIKHTLLNELTTDMPSQITPASWDVVTQAPITPLDPAAFSDYVLSAAAGTSIPDIFLDVIFTPGAFSPLTISRAIVEYTSLIINEIAPENRPEKLLDPPVYDNLAQHSADVVGCHIQLEYDAASGVPRTEEHQQKVKFEWLRFASLVGETHGRAQLPLHLAIHAQQPQQILVIQSEAISAPVIEDQCQTIRRITDPNVSSDTVRDFLELEESTVEKFCSEELVSRESRESVLRVFMLARSLIQLISLDKLRNIQDDILYMATNHLNDSPEALLRDLWKNVTQDATVDPNTKTLLQSAKETVTSNVDAFLVALDSAIEILTDVGYTFDESTTNKSTLTDDLSKTLVSSTLINQLKDRYTLSRDLMILVLFVDSCDLLGSDPESAMNRTLNVFHRSALLRWIALRGVSEEPNYPNEEGNKADDGLTNQFGAMYVANVSSLEHYPKLPASSLIHAILRTPSYALISGVSLFEDDSAATYLPTPRAITHAANYFLKHIHLLIDANFVECNAADTKFGKMLFDCGWHNLVNDYVQFWPGSAGMSYIDALAKVENCEFEQAKGEFEVAASGMMSNDETLKAVLPKGVDSLAKFYEHVTVTFEAAQFDEYISHFAQYALDEVIQGDEEGVDSSALWNKLFRSQASVGKYEESYTTLMAIPYVDIQHECLRYLVSAMCETGDVARLVQFPFTSLQPELERTLSFKARNSDALDRPNYYQILYSYYIFRGNFRDAGAIMYQHGRRLAEIPCRPGEFGELATLQARAYLSAVNSLSLVNPKNAWVVLPVTPESVSNIRKRRRLTTHIPESEFNNESKTLEIVRIEDIRHDYTLVLARLQLAQEFPELTHANLSMAPEDIVALFTQRGLFSVAIATARTLDVDMTGIFTNLSSRCLQLSKLGEYADESDVGEWILLDESASSWHGSVAERAWNYLRGSLEKHDKLERTHGKYRVAILEHLFEVDRSFDGVPSWLLSMFVSHLAPELIRIYFKFDLLNDALNTCVRVLEQANSKLKFSSSAHGQWLPYTIIDQVVTAVKESGDEIKYGDKVTYIKQLYEERTKTLNNQNIMTNGI
ncbi:hypothetical protein E3P96_02943 [Wallemia ichthyophaga]|nr:hypothetical protein E3P96_02943 [Wallemia ichthyophaga]